MRPTAKNAVPTLLAVAVVCPGPHYEFIPFNVTGSLFVWDDFRGQGTP
jgi:hypothetical protein